LPAYLLCQKLGGTQSRAGKTIGGWHRTDASPQIMKGFVLI